VILSAELFARLRRLADLDCTTPNLLALKLLDQALNARGVRDPNAPVPPPDRYIL
jgi:hypothetical protein